MDKYRKSILRDAYLQARRDLLPSLVETYNRSLLKQAQALDWSAFAVVHTFLPILVQKEPDTFRLIAWLQAEHPNAQIAVPKVDPNNEGVLTHHILEKNTVLTPSKWGIPEPSNSVNIVADLVDIALVPLLAFDRKGHRVGYGRGFYDRFLSECRPDVLKVGLSFFEPVPYISDVVETDVPLDYCITPERTYRFGLE